MQFASLVVLMVALGFKVSTHEVDLAVAAGLIFIAASLTEVLDKVNAWVTKWLNIRNAEVVFNGMAQGSAPSGLQNQVWNAAQEAFNKSRNAGKGPDGGNS